MKNENTYRAIITGTILVCAGSMIWLGISRERINQMNRDFDALKLKNEKLLSERLLLEKTSEKDSIKLSLLQVSTNRLLDSLQMQQHRVLVAEEQTAVAVRKMHLEQRNVQRLDAELSEVHQKAERAGEANSMTRIINGIKSDSLNMLLGHISDLTKERDHAVMHTIDRTLLIAKRRNENLTTKARRAKTIVAQVDLPVTLDGLSFTLVHPDGTIITDANDLTARQLINDPELSASLRGSIPLVEMKTMEVNYRPAKKLLSGKYELKIFAGAHYVGTMAIELER